MFTGYLLLILCFFGLQIQASPMYVIVDPGHGGRDSGATHKDLKESELVLSVAKLLAAKLSQDSRFHPILTRKSESFSALSNRVSFAHENKGDVLISIHANSSPDSRAKGLEVYFQNQLPPDEEFLFLANFENEHEGHRKSEKRPVASLPKPPGYESANSEVKSILQDLLRNHKISKSAELSKHIAKNWKGIKKGDRYTIRQAPFFVVTKSEIPSVLVEIGFVSNAREAKKLRTKAYKNLIADSLYRSLIEYKESIDKP